LMGASSDYADALKRYVVVGDDGLNRVRYRAWKSSEPDRRALDAYVEHLQTLSVSTLPDAERMAFWINLYNAVTLQIVLERYPVRSIRQIRSRTLDPRGLVGPWFERRVTVEGQKLSLSDVENAILRKQFNEPRIHYAINCASNGCPSLSRTLWTATDLSGQLESAASSFINSPRGRRFDDDGRPSVSRIFKWYKDDFESEGGVSAHLETIATSAFKQPPTYSKSSARHHYDWFLNDAEPERD
jgi:Protein of unknown function, DUF547